MPCQQSPIEAAIHAWSHIYQQYVGILLLTWRVYPRAFTAGRSNLILFHQLPPPHGNACRESGSEHEPAQAEPAGGKTTGRVAKVIVYLSFTSTPLPSGPVDCTATDAISPPTISPPSGKNRTLRSPAGKIPRRATAINPDGPSDQGAVTHACVLPPRVRGDAGLR
jgi:hypothetical protein